MHHQFIGVLLLLLLFIVKGIPLEMQHLILKGVQTQNTEQCNKCKNTEQNKYRHQTNYSYKDKRQDKLACTKSSPHSYLLE